MFALDTCQARTQDFLKGGGGSRHSQAPPPLGHCPRDVIHKYLKSLLKKKMVVKSRGGARPPPPPGSAPACTLPTRKGQRGYFTHKCKNEIPNVDRC